MLPLFIRMFPGSRALVGGSAVSADTPMVGLKKAKKQPDGAKTIVYEIDESEDTTTALSTFIGRELNIDAAVKRENSLIKAMQEPAKWQEERQGYYDEMKKSLGKFYAEQVTKNYNAGYSLELSKSRAQDATNKLTTILLEDIELLHPGSSTVLSNAAFKMDTVNKNFNLFNGSAEVDNEKIYKQERARRKAEKRARKQLKA